MFPFETTYQDHTFWGTGNGKIPSAIDDIKAWAGNCLAAECNTAAVFPCHANSRARTFVLLRDSLGVSLTHKGKPEPIEFATWDKVLTAIKNRLTAIAHHLPHNAKRQRQLAHYSDLQTVAPT